MAEHGPAVWPAKAISGTSAERCVHHALRNRAPDPAVRDARHGVVRAGLAATSPLLDYQDIALDNGLRVITLEDSSCPIVNVQIWYHVGSKDENPSGRASPICSST